MSGSPKRVVSLVGLVMSRKRSSMQGRQRGVSSARPTDGFPHCAQNLDRRVIMGELSIEHHDFLGDGAWNPASDFFAIHTYHGDNFGCGSREKGFVSSEDVVDSHELFFDFEPCGFSQSDGGGSCDASEDAAADVRGTDDIIVDEENVVSCGFGEIALCVEHDAFSCSLPVGLYFGLYVGDVSSDGFEPWIKALRWEDARAAEDSVESVFVLFGGVEGKRVDHDHDVGCSVDVGWV